MKVYNVYIPHTYRQRLYIYKYQSIPFILFLFFLNQVVTQDVCLIHCYFFIRLARLNKIGYVRMGWKKGWKYLYITNNNNNLLFHKFCCKIFYFTIKTKHLAAPWNNNNNSWLLKQNILYEIRHWVCWNSRVWDDLMMKDKNFNL